MRDPVVREFLLAFWKIHILHHAAEQGVYGQWMLEELQHHGYRLSPGTLYPMLARMAKRGWLRATEPKRSKAARVYRLTPRGREVIRRCSNRWTSSIGKSENMRPKSGTIGRTAKPGSPRGALQRTNRGRSRHSPLTSLMTF